MPVEAQFAPPDDDPLRSVTPAVDDVEARRARAAVEGKLFSGAAGRIAIGRYHVINKIGAGGMGVVYRAHDPELARDVALKVMNTDALSSDDAPRARGRLVREARAMAKLAHPNVIHVYDVGTVEDGVFIAMELVEGKPLSTWVAAESRPWQEVLRNYIDAGRGLAAAHEAGIVHRDFKPENVLVGDDARVRVGDFGLAGGPGSETGRHVLPTHASNDAAVDRSADASLAGSLTQTGALLGTPKYMAPEQDLGLPATVRSDQFSFCVALHEGLFGRAPFAGESVARYRENVRDGAIETPETDIPSEVVAAIHRGLAVEPADRHPSIDALLEVFDAALAEPLVVPRRRRRTVAWALGVAAALVLATTAGWVFAPREAGTKEVIAIRPDAAPPPGTEAAVPSAVREVKDPPVPAAIGDTETAATSDAPPETDPPEVERIAKTDIEPTPKRATPSRARGTNRRYCYYNENGYLPLKTSRSAIDKFTRGNRCYKCSKAAKHMLDSLQPPPDTECRTSYLCRGEGADACES